jgi:type II secretory pathway pseudopilin PulG
MKNNHSAFTLIEILITVTILIFITSVSISTYQSNLEEQSLKKEIESTFSNISPLDNQIGEKITDYQIYFHTQSSYYTYSTNTLYKNILQNLTVSGTTLSLSTNDTEEQEWII